jgi:hypothetical protein
MLLLKGFSKPLTPALEGLVMPFVARCFRCGHIETALSRWLINVCMEEHDLASHLYHDREQWTVAIITNADYYMIERLSKISTFWAAQRIPKRLLHKLAH